MKLILYSVGNVRCSDLAVCLSGEGGGGVRDVSLVFYTNGMCCLMRRPKLLLRGASQQVLVQVVQVHDMFHRLEGCGWLV